MTEPDPASGRPEVALRAATSQPLCAEIDGDFVIFLIGMRVNRPLRLDLW